MPCLLSKIRCFIIKHKALKSISSHDMFFLQIHLSTSLRPCCKPFIFDTRKTVLKEPIHNLQNVLKEDYKISFSLRALIHSTCWPPWELLCREEGCPCPPHGAPPCPPWLPRRLDHPLLQNTLPPPRYLLPPQRVDCLSPHQQRVVN